MIRSMIINTKNKVMFVVAVALGGVALLIPAFAGVADSSKGDAERLGVDMRQNREPNQASELKQDLGKPVTNEPESDKSIFKVDSLFGNDPNFAGRSDDNPGIGELTVKMLVAVLLVVALGAAAIYVSKKLLPRITNLPGKEIRIVATVHLGPRKAVHLLKIGSQKFLIGSTNERITKLADLTNGPTDFSTQDKNDY